MARIAIMALENLEVEEAVGTDIPVEEIADQPENDLAEMQEISTEMEGGDDSIDEAADTADTLGDVRDQMAETITGGEGGEGGGMEPAAAAAVEVAVEHMCKRLGFPAKRSGFALEAFADKTTRVQATKIAMETIGEQIKKIWDAIVAAFKTAIAWLVKFYDKMFDGASKLAKRANALAVAAEAKIKDGATLDKGEKVTKGLTNQFNFAKYLVKSNKFMSGSEILSACKALTTKGTAYEDYCFKLASSAGPLSEESASVSNLTGYIDSFVSTMTPTATTKQKPPEGMSAFESPLPFGNYSIFAFAVKQGGGNASRDIGKVKMFVASNSEAEAKGDYAGESFELKDIVSVSKEIENHMNKYSAIRVKQKQLSDSQSAIQAAAEKASKKSDAADTKVEMEKAACARAIISLTSSGLASIRSYDISACKAVLDYASKSLGNYSKAA